MSGGKEMAFWWLVFIMELGWELWLVWWCHRELYRFVNIDSVNTWRMRQNGSHFADDIFKCIFLNENVWVSLKFVPKVQINHIPTLVQMMAWHWPDDVIVHWCIYASLGFNELNSHCLMTWSHYLNQCWLGISLIINWNIRKKKTPKKQLHKTLQWNFSDNTKLDYQLATSAIFFFSSFDDGQIRESSWFSFFPWWKRACWLGWGLGRKVCDAELDTNKTQITTFPKVL